jgi:serine phosphatase RsbU (regulator of sigma subunit)
MIELATETRAGYRHANRILVVEDDRVSNRVLCLRLERMGFVVLSVVSGEEALAWLETGAVDVIFLDVSMPGMSGLDVLRRIRGNGLDAAVIMMTAYGTEDIAVEALRRGADDYLRKPLETAELDAVLSRTVSRLELERQNVALRLQLEQQRLQLQAELTRASKVQMDLLPDRTPSIPGFDLAGRCVPARDVGGDYYSWMEPEPGALAITLGDVMGKGMPAALLMATVRAAVRTAAQRNSPATVLEVAARALGGDLERASSFVTLFHARLDATKRRLAYVDVGHGHVFVRRADGSVETLPERGLPLGVLPEERYEEGTVEFSAGDALVLYSDGLIDARPDLDLEPEDVAAQLEGVSGAEAMVERLVGLADTGEPLPDDLTVVVLECVQDQTMPS